MNRVKKKDKNEKNQSAFQFLFQFHIYSQKSHSSDRLEQLVALSKILSDMYDFEATSQHEQIHCRIYFFSFFFLPNRNSNQISIREWFFNHNYLALLVHYGNFYLFCFRLKF